jgi:hypothetical protein
MVFIMVMKTETNAIPLKNGLHQRDEDQNQLYFTQNWSSSTP